MFVHVHSRLHPTHTNWARYICGRRIFSFNLSEMNMRMRLCLGCLLLGSRRLRSGLESRPIVVPNGVCYTFTKRDTSRYHMFIRRDRRNPTWLLTIVSHTQFVSFYSFCRWVQYTCEDLINTCCICICALFYPLWCTLYRLFYLWPLDSDSGSTCSFYCCLSPRSWWFCMPTAFLPFACVRIVCS